jgi:outer membrane protein
MGIENKFFAFIKASSVYQYMAGRQAKFLLSAVVLLIFFSVSIAALSQGGQEKFPALNEDSSSDTEASVQASAGNKMGFADFLTIYHSYSKTKIEDERLKEEGQELQGKIDVDKNKITELEKRMNSGILSEEEKENLGKEIEELKTQIAGNIQEFNVKIDSERRQAIDKLVADLKDKISNYGKEKGYVMIFDQSQLIFSDTRLELTQEIIDYINKNSNE